MKAIFVIWFLMPVMLANVGSSQTISQDVVYLKNGTVVRGEIIEYISGVSVKIKLADDSVLIYKIEDVDRLVKEQPFESQKSENTGKRSLEPLGDSLCPQLANHTRSEILKDLFLKSRIEIQLGWMSTKIYKSKIPSSVDIKEWRYWSAYCGTKPLSESAFFTLCGYPDKAAKARLHYARADRQIGIGNFFGTLGMAGLLVGSYASFIARGQENWAIPTLIAGGAITFISTLTHYSGYKNRYKSYATYDIAKTTADDYNKKLCDSLSSAP